MFDKNASRVLLELPVENVKPNPRQPRKFFDEDALADLAKSISEVGLIQPIVVHPDGGGYEIIAGERRWRASKSIGLEKIPCIVLNIDNNSRQIISLVENIHRSDLSAIEEARSIKDLLDNTDWNQTELGGYLGRSQAFIANKLRLLKLDQSVQKMLLERKLSERQARFLLTIPPDEQLDVAMKMITEGLRGDDLNRFAPPPPAQEQEEEKEIEPEEPKQTDFHADPAAVFFEKLGQWADEGRAHGIPISWTIREITQSELVAEIRVDLKPHMK